MAKCRRCTTVLEGRRQLCDPCKAGRPGTADVVKVRGKKSAPKPAAAAAAKSSTLTKPSTEAPAKPATPPGLHKRGRELWEHLGRPTGSALGELALEICRLADRLDELDRIIAGKGVLQLMQFRVLDDYINADGEQRLTVKVGFQAVLTEARLQQATFKELLKEFRAAAAAAPTGKGSSSTGPAGPTPAPPPATGVDQLAARRAERESGTG